ncbi:hypothetical protein [Mycobacteroides abscessus]|uniref:hypothetical protein n=1 Tax=Mycobacteroides abscessus TaxID=36809 RepID=UPI0009A8C154|nr:hypothetical protein [Mycobacteroides abscessus]MDO3032208.1 hypothetical protein [Mycobacteroides abscessus subsp. massiliense]MDO3042113.1 hypothetical protein [Mycobacteroides abscessus subsp. abscessus]MDO3111546.1 hypothetical protein [Mycobacteroides abscessus subsp. massiliense]RIR19251.1 hypothetical protein D2E28_23430 [Mycobacteroides abscessus]SKU70891.1 Uncharacterised protein [Mycobacteroides abscessus subsp. massiliense]
MAEEATEALVPDDKRDWRKHESRQRRKLLAKRVSDDDHAVVDWYAKEVANQPISELLEPAFVELIEKARAAWHAKVQAGDTVATQFPLTLASA